MKIDALLKETVKRAVIKHNGSITSRISDPNYSKAKVLALLRKRPDLRKAIHTHEVATFTAKEALKILREAGIGLQSYSSMGKPKTVPYVNDTPLFDKATGHKPKPIQQMWNFESILHEIASTPSAKRAEVLAKFGIIWD